MLVLSRYAGESIKIGNIVTVKVVRVEGNKVKLGIEAPDHIVVDRTEIAELKAKQNNENKQERVTW